MESAVLAYEFYSRLLDRVFKYSNKQRSINIFMRFLQASIASTLRVKRLSIAFLRKLSPSPQNPECKNFGTRCSRKLFAYFIHLVIKCEWFCKHFSQSEPPPEKFNIGKRFCPLSKGIAILFDIPSLLSSACLNLSNRKFKNKFLRHHCKVLWIWEKTTNHNGGRHIKRRGKVYAELFTPFEAKKKERENPKKKRTNFMWVRLNVIWHKVFQETETFPHLSLCKQKTGKSLRSFIVFLLLGYMPSDFHR